MLFTCIKSRFCRNHLANFHQISHWSFCWNVIDSLFKWSCSIDCEAHIFFFKTKNCSNDDIFINCDDRIGKMLHNICMSAVAMSLRWANRSPWASCLLTTDFYIPPHNSGGYLWYRISLLCVRLFADDNLSKDRWIFTYLSMCIDIVEIWFGIDNLCPGYDVKLHPAVILNMSMGMVRLPSITVASPPSGLRGCHNLGGRARQAIIYRLMAWCSSYCGLADDPFFIRTTAKHTAWVQEWRACSDAIKELSWTSGRTGDPVKTVVPKSFMASTTVESEIDGANRHKSSVGNASGLASCQVWEAGSGHCGESSKHLRKFRVGTLNVNTLRERVCEVVETLSRRKVDVCCIQETRYHGGNCRTIKGKDTRYKLDWSGNDKGTAGVGVFVVEE